jgi:hypothetical protein
LGSDRIAFEGGKLMHHKRTMEAWKVNAPAHHARGDKTLTGPTARNGVCVWVTMENGDVITYANSHDKLPEPPKRKSKNARS